MAGGLLIAALMVASSTPRPSILVVDVDARALETRVRWLREAGYEASVARTFEEGKRLLDDAPPTLLITAVRLGAFNGLHLVVRGRARNPQLCALALGEPGDEGLRSDAMLSGALFAVVPQTRHELLALVRDALAASPT